LQVNHMKRVSAYLLGLGLSFALTALFPFAFAQTAPATVPPGDLYKLLGAGLAFGLAAAGAGYGLGQSGAAAIAAVVEKPEVRTTALIFVALAEAIAIYGFVMAIIILGQP
jgi:V/A-type H+/Na+-transporting ATPase subunit K